MSEGVISLAFGSLLLGFIALIVYQVKTGNNVAEKIITWVGDYVFPLLYIVACVLMIINGITQILHAK